jgi:hypothetical protein
LYLFLHHFSSAEPQRLPNKVALFLNRRCLKFSQFSKPLGVTKAKQLCKNCKKTKAKLFQHLSTFLVWYCTYTNSTAVKIV